MNERDVWRTTTSTIMLAVFITAALPRISFGRDEERKGGAPNVVLILADDLGAKELGCYGNTKYKTPNLDALAKTGTMFRTCWATPVCTPSRGEIMTGRYGFRTGWFANGMPFPVGDSGVKTNLGRSDLVFASLLKSAGYATAVSGRWVHPGHLSTSVVRDDYGFDEYFLWPIWSKRLLRQGLQWDGPMRLFGGKPILLPRYWHPCILRNGKLVRTAEGDYGPDMYTDFVIDFVKRNKHQPFMVYYPMCLTHSPFLPTPDTVAVADDKMLSSRDNFKANVEYMDRLVGRIIRALDDLGLRGNTIVFFTGDNGTGGQGKAQTTELGVRVPMIVNCPGTVRAGVVSDELIDFSDVLPTLADLAGAVLPHGHEIDGRSFAPILRGEKCQPREWIFSYLGFTRMLRDKRWLLESNSPESFGRLYDCRDSRDGTGYEDVTHSQDPEVVAARQRFEQILERLPRPDLNDPRMRKRLEIMKQKQQEVRELRERKRLEQQTKRSNLPKV